MTRVDFYISQEAAPGTREQLACRLAEKAYKLGHDVFIHTASQQDAKRVDELLWSFRDGSFVPHDVTHEAGPAKVSIGAGDEPTHTPHLLINLAAEVPSYFSRFERVAEIVDGIEDNKAAGRERYKFYKDRGYELGTNNL
ncbi:MAG: DNA polymerase III subunit chi [Gammaproteobacteria bacterium]|nr:DNA polymerase III subunit chi [Gammaproteobacteria bacterium]